MKLASTFFAQTELDRRLKVLHDFIDRHRDTFGDEPVCKVLQIVPSCYWLHAACQRHPELNCTRFRCDHELDCLGSAHLARQRAGLQCRQGLQADEPRKHSCGPWLMGKPEPAGGSGFAPPCPAYRWLSGSSSMRTDFRARHPGAGPLRVPATAARAVDSSPG